MKILLTAFCFLAFSNFCYSQNLTNKVRLTLKDNPPVSLNTLPEKSLNTSSAQFNPLSLIYGLILLPNPQVQLDNKKVYFGLTKQLSVMIYRAWGFGVGRIGFEYTYAFAKEHPNQFRALYIQDFVISVGDFAASLFSVEGGYFNDLDKKGISAGAGASILLMFVEPLYVNPYLKLRHTFMLKNQSNITDFTLGAGIGFYF